MESHSPGTNSDPATTDRPDSVDTSGGAGDALAPLSVRIYSDVVCPWCYIGKRRFEAALALPEAPPVSVRWLPFQLDPDAPVPGGPVADAYAKKFGGEDRARAIMDQVTETAAGEGLGFRLDRAVRSNPFDAHRLLWWASSVAWVDENRPARSSPDDGVLPDGRLAGAQSALKESLLAAYFVEGLDVSDRRVLADRAAAVGLDADEAAEVLASDAGASEVRTEIAGAAAADVTAVPTFVLDGRLAIPGAQDAATIARYLNRIAATRGR